MMRDRDQRMGRRLFAAFVLAGSTLAGVARAEPTEFPEGAQPVEAKALHERLNGKVVTVKLESGLGWRIDHKSSGFFFVDVSNGARDSGKWSADESKICYESRARGGRDCNEVRLLNNQLFVKRSQNGQVIRFELAD